MKVCTTLYSTCHHFYKSNLLQISEKQEFLSQNGLRNYCIFHSRKPMIVINPVVTVRASSSSPSPSLGASSDYSGAQLKKKQSSVAGIDQDDLLDPRHLADPDSYFCEFKGVHIHYKVCEAESSMSKEQEVSKHDALSRRTGFPMIFLHGFGASTFSWHRVMKPFAQITGSKVLAFDRPAFGLTSRVHHSVSSDSKDDTKPLNPYSIAFSVLATLYFIDFLKSEKAVLVGHSAGSVTAVETYFEAPNRVAALILVAPAIIAPLSAPKSENKKNLPQENQVQESNCASDRHPNILVRMIIDKFGVAAVKNAWYDASQVTDHILQGYTKPLRTKNWDRALLEYTVAMLTGSEAKLKPPLEKRLQKITCPVLIITGDSDRLVPSWNSERLSRAIPGSQLETIKNCGHLPHEEKPDEFISVVANFLHRVLSGSEELCMRA
ncbi:uncharacterized protein LOC130800624 isoform X2 [Amaranthus tricolor]|uniref:uncharacterized protein LOC130800624 isoform X2 n=1 Tax=Amaranthus tricolor TaxID=29722 RepID=UPI0025912969|nr:uncharacterized protein LOC130800624 isoform X2 [Amaranthus tricolor]